MQPAPTHARALRCIQAGPRGGAEQQHRGCQGRQQVQNELQTPGLLSPSACPPSPHSVGRAQSILLVLLKQLVVARTVATLSTHQLCRHDRARTARHGNRCLAVPQTTHTHPGCPCKLRHTYDTHSGSLTGRARSHPTRAVLCCAVSRGAARCRLPSATDGRTRGQSLSAAPSPRR